MSHYQTLDHTADLGLELWAETLDGLFALGVEAMFTEMGVPTSIANTSTQGDSPQLVELDSVGMDLDDLFVCALSDALGTLEQHSFFCRRAKARVRQLEDGEWAASLLLEGVSFDRSLERNLVEFKAVTYHGLLVEPLDDGWHARVTFDL